MVHEMVEEIQQFFEQLLNKAQLNLDILVETTQEEIVVQLSGQDSGLLLANNARLLHALNQLLNQSFYRKGEGKTRFTVDCNGYRKARVFELEALADEAAKKSARTGQSVRFQPMPAFDRRIIHLHLAACKGVRTESDGRGRNRCVVVICENR